jgi:ESF2/ABP1 family protein
MRAEISKSTKENKEFVQNVERAKMLEGMEAKKASKRRLEDDDVAVEDKPVPEKRQKNTERPRHFKQTAVASKRRPEDQSEQVKRVLSKIF